MKQIALLPKTNTRIEHGGSLLIGKRRRRRPLNIKNSHHLTLRSDYAYGSRSLLRHRPLIERIIKKASKNFHIKVYEQSVVSNHIHLLVKGQTRVELQNFFRVVAGHIAQQILRRYPILAHEKSKRGGALNVRENQFWESRIYTKIVSWGRQFVATKNYIVMNTLEALRLIPYQARKNQSKNNFGRHADTS